MRLTRADASSRKILAASAFSSADTLPPVLYQTGISDSQTVSEGPDLWESGLGQGGELPLKFTQAVRFQAGH